MAAAILITGLLALAGKAIAEDPVSYTGPPGLGVFQGCFTVISIPDKACNGPEECQKFCQSYGGYWAWTVDGSYCVTMDELTGSDSCHKPCGETFEQGLCPPEDGSDCNGFPVYKCPPPGTDTETPEAKTETPEAKTETPEAKTKTPAPPSSATSTGSTPPCSTPASSTSSPPPSPASSTSPEKTPSSPHTHIASTPGTPTPGECTTSCTTKCGNPPTSPCPTGPPPAGQPPTTRLGSEYPSTPGGPSGSSPPTTLSKSTTGTPSSPSGGTATVSTSTAGAAHIHAGAWAVFLAVVIVAAQ